ncbi:peptidoglycan/LPS O-acetylase OafA/YrhL [Rhizobium mesoamericanum]|nr:peptidoglycan/LPS O-acetylase OafA/YrhL [Rhizobium mesoamericanum]
MSHGLTNLFGINLLDGAGSVLIFFAISGFLITLALTKKYDATLSGHVGFYWNRIMRLYPIYWAWLLITIGLYFWTPFGTLTYQKTEIASFWLDNFSHSSIGTLLTAGFANVTSIFIDSFLSLNLAADTGHLTPKSQGETWSMGFIFIGQFWSISVEIAFYLLAPLFVRSPIRTAAMFLLSISGALHLGWSHITAAAGLPLAIQMIRAPESMWIFMLGSLLAHAYTASTGNRRALCTILAAACYAYIFAVRDSLFPTFEFPWWQFSAFTAAIPALFHFTRKSRIDGFIGSLSYPVYVVHFQLIQILGTLVHPSGPLFAAASVVVSTIIVFAIDRPISKLKWDGSRGRQTTSCLPQAEPLISSDA